MHFGPVTREFERRPRQDSNLRNRLRRPVLYPLSYGGLQTADLEPKLG